MLKAENAMLKKNYELERAVTQESREKELEMTNRLVTLQERIEVEMWG